ncbi:MAG: GNAT family N-acetyltransferase [candidate division WS1 bacterium]|nr:GNAT family N-acetyltransferase [candidate division WS1 bacterium]
MSVDPVDLRIEPLSPQHLGELLTFYRSLSADVAWFYRPFEPVDGATLGAHLEGVAAGRCRSWAVRGPEGAILGHGFIGGLDAVPVLGIGLHQDYLSRGIGRRLMEWMLDDADARRLAVVTLTVMKANERARRLYERVGFAVTGEADFRAPGDSLAMERRLPTAANGDAPCDKG